jgi:hypothetical protein
MLVTRSVDEDEDNRDDSVDAVTTRPVEDDDDDGVPAAAVASSSPKLPVLAGLLAAVNVVALAFVCSRVAHQMAGARNASVPFAIAWPDAVAGLLWLASGVYLVRVALAGRGAARHVALGGLAACLAAVPASCQTAASGHDRYEQGFATWAATKVDAGAIRGWVAGLPAVPAATAVPTDQWPPAVAGLAPGNVEQLPHGRGVVLQWGTLATWGTSRRVFVAGRPTGVPPPEDDDHPWRLVQEGVYAATQGPG